MPLDFEIEFEGEDETVLTLPYEQNFENGRTNHGFRDIRGRPELAHDIHEAARSPALKELLVALAGPASRYFSIGCDFAAWPPVEAGDPYQAGGYIQLASSDLQQEAIDHRRHLLFGRDLQAHLRRVVGDDSWVVRVVVAAVSAVEIAGPEQIWSPVVEFCAMGPTDRDACASTERLIKALRDFMAPAAALQ